MKTKTIIGAITVVLLSIMLSAKAPDVYASESTSNSQTSDLTPKLDTEVGKYGYVNQKGKWVITPQFSIADEFSEGLACVRYFIDTEGPNTGYINSKGEPAFSTRFYGGYAYKDGYAIVEREDGKISIIDKKGKVKLKTDYYCSNPNPMMDGIYAHIGVSPLSRGDLPQIFGYITNDFKLVKPMFDGMVGYYTDNYSEERILTGIIRQSKDEYSLYLINSDYKPIKLPSTFIISIKEGMILLQCGKYYAFADMKGKIYDEIYSPETKEKHKFDWAASFSEGYAVVRVDRLLQDSYGRLVPGYGYIKKDGTSFKEPIYLSANSFKGGIAAVRLVPRAYYGMGILKSNGSYLLSPKERTPIKIDDKYKEYFDSMLHSKGEYDYVLSEVKKIVKQETNSNMSDVEKIAALNKYVIDHTTYGGNMDYNLTPRGLWYCHDALGILKDGWGVCDAYAKLLGLLLIEAGFETQMVVGFVGGTAKQNAHAWNMVKIGKNYYHLDATFNDEKGPFKYFLVSDKYLKSLSGLYKRIWEESDYPAATKGYYDDKPVERTE